MRSQAGDPGSPESVPLLTALRRPETVAEMAPMEWDVLVPESRAAGVLGHLGARLEELGILSKLPPRLQDHFRAALNVASDCHRAIRWEVDRIQRALAPTGAPIVLLKGAAYVLAQLTAARGRVFSDVDILVPKDALDDVEAALLRHGWEAVKLDPYDQRYYRTWMHELPPLRHRHRRTVVDVHHTILPKTGRLQPDPGALLRAVQPLPRHPCAVLAPTDMVLHTAAHLFQDGELRTGLRELVDIHLLTQQFGADHAFWDRLIERAGALHLGRPLFYAVRYCRRFLGTPVPRSFTEHCGTFGPSRTVLSVMDWLVARSLLPHEPESPSRSTRLARQVLYMRSHWLRMPPHLLALHLSRNALFRARKARPRV